MGAEASVIVSGDTTVETSNILVNPYGHLTLHQVAFFNGSVSHQISVRIGATLDITDITVTRTNPSGSQPPRIWGGGNTTTSLIGFLDAFAHGCYDTAVTSFPHITTGTDVYVRGTNKTWADLPYIDASQAGFVPR